ncbi:unnamed protein product [Nezara viridula]|uniref:Uncharacterized protein n=1 Tax=Nezara viridula TaxID=85310 RepID=A0A9P0MNV8_NEZVI|nr:unnamed protein product [Nezara viridula]
MNYIADKHQHQKMKYWGEEETRNDIFAPSFFMKRGLPSSTLLPLQKSAPMVLAVINAMKKNISGVGVHSQNSVQKNVYKINKI